ncbi:MAG: radical SAM protein [Candidatus Zixiibacteriota bacterium]
MKDFGVVRKSLLGAEKGRITKGSGAVRVALGFPNTYEVGISNLGFQTVYRLLNQTDHVVCERFFQFYSPTPGGTKTLESDRNIRDFDLIAFSIPFELDYPNVLELLKLSRIPLLSSERRSLTPLIVGGGVTVTLNPEVLAPFFDCLFIGEAEEMLSEFMEIYLQSRLKKTLKEELLLDLSRIKGVYVPGFYQVTYHRNGCVKGMTAKEGAPSVIARRWAKVEGLETFSPLISPYAHFKNSLLIEVGRGCIWGCRFCAAGHIYQPCRFYKKESIFSQAEKYAGDSKHLGLVGSVISDHPELEEICETLHQRGFEIGTSSLRVDMVSQRLLTILVESGMRTLTIAPEVGTEKMWRVIKKNLERRSVLESAELASKSGIQTLKLYFMVGLPFEEEPDIRGIVDLIREVHRIFLADDRPRKPNLQRRHSAKRIRLSINPFVPKPHTPFQWCAMNREKELKRKLNEIADGIKDLRGIFLEKKSLRQAVLQAIFSLGNRKVGEALFYTIEGNLSYRQAWEKADVDPDSIAFDPRSVESVLPWDIVDTGISKSFLRSELEKARSVAKEYEGKTSPFR